MTRDVVARAARPARAAPVYPIPVDAGRRRRCGARRSSGATLARLGLATRLPRHGRLPPAGGGHLVRHRLPGRLDPPCTREAAGPAARPPLADRDSAQRAGPRQRQQGAQSEQGAAAAARTRPRRWRHRRRPAAGRRRGRPRRRRNAPAGFAPRPAADRGAAGRRPRRRPHPPRPTPRRSARRRRAAGVAAGSDSLARAGHRPGSGQRRPLRPRSPAPAPALRERRARPPASARATAPPSPPRPCAPGATAGWRPSWSSASPSRPSPGRAAPRTPSSASSAACTRSAAPTSGRCARRPSWRSCARRAARDGPDGLRAACRAALARHASTRERLPVLDVFYPRDLRPHRRRPGASSIWPAAWAPWPGRGWACRRRPATSPTTSTGAWSTWSTALLTLCDVPHVAALRDVVGRPPDEPADVALLLKAAPCLEQQDPGEHPSPARRASTPGTWSVSFPTRSLGRRRPGDGRPLPRSRRSTARPAGNDPWEPVASPAGRAADRLPAGDGLPARTRLKAAIPGDGSRLPATAPFACPPSSRTRRGPACAPSTRPTSAPSACAAWSSTPFTSCAPRAPA